MKKRSTIFVTVRDGDNVQGALKRFKRMCEAFGVSKEYRKRKDYKKPSVKSKEKRESAEKRRKKDMKKSTRRSKI